MKLDILKVIYIFTFISTQTCVAQVWYVDKDSQGENQDGSTWETAFSQVQDAIDAAASTGGGEVWIAAGIYDEERVGNTSLSRPGALELKTGVDIYGGFAGKETLREQRDWERNACIIDGLTSRGGELAYSVAACEHVNGITVDGLTFRN